MKFFEHLFRPGDVFKPGREAKIYLLVMLCFGLACGCFFGVMNNYLADPNQVDLNENGRGTLEFFRELPGLFLVVILALLAKRDEWWILRMGFGVALVGLAGLLLAPPLVTTATIFIVLWSVGEHVLMPVRSSITLHLAKPKQEGGAMGVLGGLGSLATVAGGLVVFGIFKWLKPDIAFSSVFGLTFVLLLAGLCISFLVKSHGDHVKRPRLYFNRKYNKFYILEIFYGARKQVFITFAPFMLIKMYNMETAHFALLGAICAAVNIFCAPVAGWIIDRLGYRTVMIWDTVFLMFVCLAYGYADVVFPLTDTLHAYHNVAFWVVCIAFVLDAVITNASMATNIYVQKISSSREELTSTLSTGISVNHLISILVALLGGWLIAAVAEWSGSKSMGYGALFTFSAFMALMNTLFAITIPKTPKSA